MVGPVFRLVQIADVLAIGTAIIRRQHPGDQKPEVAGTQDGAQQAEVPVVVDVAEILVLHGLLLSINLLVNLIYIPSQSTTRAINVAVC